MKPSIITVSIIGFLALCALLPTGSMEPDKGALGRSPEYTERLPLYLMGWDAIVDDWNGGRIDIDDFHYTYIRFIAWLTGEDQYYQ